MRRPHFFKLDGHWLVRIDRVGCFVGATRIEALARYHWWAEQDRAPPQQTRTQTMEPHPTPAGEALVVVDVQNDFVTGSLAVPNGGAFAVLPHINALIDDHVERGKPVFYTRCFHIHNHPSFKEHGGPWPAHCVMGTTGAEPPAELHLVAVPGGVIAKGTDHECYSGFEVLRAGEPSVLERVLRHFGATRVTVCGIATDYCVKHTALDAARLGFDVVVPLRACAAIAADTEAAAIAEMRGMPSVTLV